MVKILSFVNHVATAPDIERSIDRAFEWGVDYIVSQGTGMDWGPYYLGSGKTINVDNFKENVRPYLRAARRHKVPFILSVGIGGGRPHLETCLSAIAEVAAEDGWDARIAVFDTEMEHETLKRLLRDGAEPVPMGADGILIEELTADRVDECIRIVSLMGPEPIQEALKEGVDGVITGRALDTGLFMAPLLSAQIHKGTAAHAGKILECGGVALWPGHPGQCIWADVAEDSFEVRSPNPHHQATVKSLSAHSFYERSNPWKEENPGGYLDLGNVEYADTEFGVLCSGARWVDEPYSIVVEGVTSLGFRSLSLMGVRDPAYLKVMPTMEEAARANAKAVGGLSHLKYGEDYEIHLRIYGLNATLGALEPHPVVTGHEGALLLDVVARTQEIADEVCWVTFMFLYFNAYEGRKTTAGNGAAPFMPVVLPAGEVFGFNVYHIVPLADPISIYPFEITQISTYAAGVSA